MFLPILSSKNEYFHFLIDTSLYCPTSVIVTANISQEKSMENSVYENDKNNKIGEY